MNYQREMSADNLAVAVTGQPVTYARVLEFVGRKRLGLPAPQFGTAMGGTKMTLLSRVRNVLGIVPAETTVVLVAGGTCGIATAAGALDGSRRAAQATRRRRGRRQRPRRLMRRSKSLWCDGQSSERPALESLPTYAVQGGEGPSASVQNPAASIPSVGNVGPIKPRPSEQDEMQARAEGTTVFELLGSDKRPAELVAEPAIRYVDRFHSIVEGTLWIYGTQGRPVAVQKLERYRRPDFPTTCLYGLFSLSDNLIEAQWPGEPSWTSTKPGIERRPPTPQESGAYHHGLRRISWGELQAPAGEVRSPPPRMPAGWRN